MSNEISSALGYSGELPTAARTRELMTLNYELSSEELNELMRALLAPPSKDDPIAARSTWFNEIANLLERQPVNVKEYSEVLGTVARDEKRNLVTRDYALQHLRRAWAMAGSDLGLRQSIEATFEEMAAVRGDLQPTVLLSIHLLDPSGKNGVSDSALVSEVRAILSDEKATGDAAVRSRMVASRIAGERHLENMRSPLLKLATSESAHALERMAAIAALGRFGNPVDLEALAALAPQDRRVAGAIHSVLGSASR